jgi:hypothetical protein
VFLHNTNVLIKSQLKWSFASWLSECVWREWVSPGHFCYSQLTHPNQSKVPSYLSSPIKPICEDRIQLISAQAFHTQEFYWGPDIVTNSLTAIIVNPEIRNILQVQPIPHTTNLHTEGLIKKSNTVAAPILQFKSYKELYLWMQGCQTLNLGTQFQPVLWLSREPA